MKSDLVQRLMDLGAERGHAAATWVEQDNLQAILQGIEDCDPMIVDNLPAPLSGEFAGDVTPRSLAEEVGVEELSTEDLDDYEGAWHEAYNAHLWERAKGLGIVVVQS